MAGGSKKYDESYRVRALLLLQHNGFNQKKTCEELGLNNRTLMRWRNLYGSQVFNTDDLTSDDKGLIPIQREKQIKTLRSQILDKEEDFLEVVYQARELSLNKGIELLETEKDLKKVTDFMRIAHEIVTGDHVKSLDERKPSTFVQLVMNNWNSTTNQQTNNYEADKKQGNQS